VEWALSRLQPQITRKSAEAEAPPRPAVESSAFEAAILPHLDAAYTLARYLTRRADIAEDIVQEAMLRAYRRFETSRGENPRAWLLAIVRNCFLTWKTCEDQSERRRGGNSDVEDASFETPDQATPESILLDLERTQAVRAVIESLPDVFREVLVLRDIEDLSYRDIAGIIGAPIGTVMSRLARARKLFAAAWQPSKESKP
jgi:RNA polymerase sigma-70 factor, ECF subfamily